MKVLKNFYYTILFIIAIMMLVQAWYVSLAIVVLFVVYKFVSIYSKFTDKGD